MTRRAAILSAVGAIAAVALLVAMVVALAPRLPLGHLTDATSTPDAPALTFAEQSPPPALAADPGPGYSGLVDRQWAQAVADATGIPLLAVVGYAAGALGAEDNFPGCGIGWNMLAGIGLVESDHGRHGGGVIDSIG
ncbi:MAG: murein transglycosylase, partial [Rhodoglobus sp.]